MLRIIKHIFWLSVVTGISWFIYYDWRATGSRVELATLVCAGILFLRMSYAAEVVSGVGVALISITLAVFTSPVVYVFLSALLGGDPLHNFSLSSNRQWWFLIIFVASNLGLRPKSPKGRVPRRTLRAAQNILRGKTFRLVFEPEELKMGLLPTALEREIFRLFEEADMKHVEDNPELTLRFLSSNGQLKFQFQLPNVNTDPLDFVDVELRGRYSTLEGTVSRSMAKAPGYAEQAVYSIAALVIDPTGNTKL